MIISDLPQRLTDKMQSRPNVNGCWIWNTSHRSGYGIVQWPHPDGRKRADGRDPIAQAHRVVYHLLKDPTLAVYPGRSGTAKVLDHKCNNRACVNPDHLEETTNRANCLSGRNCELRPGKSSRFRGVYWDKRNSKWFAQIQIDGKQFFLGRHTSEEEASRAYEEKKHEVELRDSHAN